MRFLLCSERVQNCHKCTVSDDLIGLPLPVIPSTQQTFTYSKLTLETLEKGVKYDKLTIKTPE